MAEITPEKLQELYKIVASKDRRGVLNYDKAVNSLIGSSGVTSQNLAEAKGIAREIGTALDAHYKAETTRLQQINPAFNPENYHFGASKVANWGEGASSMRGATLAGPALDVFSRLDALKMAEEAATEYERTGQIKPYPTKVELAARAYPYNANRPDILEQIAKREGGDIPESERSAANAAAARVGGNLPYPQSEMGKPGAGGLFTSAEEASRFYDDAGSLKPEFEQYQQYDQAGKAQPGFRSQQPGFGDQAVQPPALGQTGTTQQQQPMGSAGAMGLVQQALNSGDLTNLQQQGWWNSQPENIRQEAYSMLTGAFQNPQQLASLVQQAGVTDLQNKSWWANYPQKQQAWDIMQSGQAQPGATGTAQAGVPGVQGQVDGQAGVTGQQPGVQSALDFINNSDLDPGVKALFGEIVEGWDPSKEINAMSVIEEFQKIKSQTIDPQFQQQADLFIDDVKRTQAYSNEMREQELSGEQMQSQQQLEDTQRGLEARGMTRSGEALQTLGDVSGARFDPTQKQFYQFGQQGEGKLQAQQRLMSSSSQARYMKNLADMQRQTERTLGTPSAKQMFPEIKGVKSQTGGVTGSIAQQKTAAEASTLSNLYGQQQQNYEANKAINLF